ncbi:hypothetical protein PVAP13_4KG058100 [Panicum virgatum]|uniref:Uncharacterized protein n=1 Tax=Panicum virgatum TaxID=38727 RepID=A0A8T0TIN3_PANVG|nr:hypothetical protein PVAP13_4KG058100 [Panicum virgatum]
MTHQGQEEEESARKSRETHQRERAGRAATGRSRGAVEGEAPLVRRGGAAPGRPRRSEEGRAGRLAVSQIKGRHTGSPAGRRERGAEERGRREELAEEEGRAGQLAVSLVKGRHTGSPAGWHERGAEERGPAERRRREELAEEEERTGQLVVSQPPRSRAAGARAGRRSCRARAWRRNRRKAWGRHG